MSSLAELRKELREHRKTSVLPVSRMKKGDVMLELERRRVSKPAVEEEKPVEKVKMVLKKAAAVPMVVEKAAKKVVEKKKITAK